MSVATVTLHRLSGRPVVSLAMLCLLFLICAPLWSATAAGAGAPPISGSAVTPNSLPPGLGGYPTYLGGSGGYPGSSYPGYQGGNAGYPGYSGGNAGYPGYPGGNAGYPGYPGVSGSYPGGGLNQQSGYPNYGSTSVDACTLCFWRNNYYQWYRQAYATYEQMSYDPCLACSYSYYGGR